MLFFMECCLFLSLSSCFRLPVLEFNTELTLDTEEAYHSANVKSIFISILLVQRNSWNGLYVIF